MILKNLISANIDNGLINFYINTKCIFNVVYKHTTRNVILCSMLLSRSYKYINREYSIVFCLLSFYASEICCIGYVWLSIEFNGTFSLFTPCYLYDNFIQNFCKMPPTKHPLQLLPISCFSTLLFSLATSAVVAVVGWQKFFFPYIF